MNWQNTGQTPGKIWPSFLTLTNARKMVREVGGAVTTWRDVANSVGSNKSDQDRMSSAFEHEDLEHALRL